MLMTLASAVLATGLAVLAEGPAGGRRAKELGLTQEQTQKLESLRYEHRKETADLRHQIQGKRLDLRREMEKDSPDPSVLDRLVEEAGALKVKLQKARIRHRLEVKTIFTPEQWEKVRENFGPRAGRGGDPGKMGRGRRGGGPGPEGAPGRGRGPCLNPGSGDGPGPRGGGGFGPGRGMGPCGGTGPGSQGPFGDDDEDDGEL
jgi:Spy/CpxP family protein refolding chaperone